MTSASSRSGSAAWNDATWSADSSASCTPAGLRSHTPISHTASTPGGVTWSHSAAGTLASVVATPGPLADVVEPGRRVQLVDDRVGRPRLAVHCAGARYTRFPRSEDDSRSSGRR